MNNSIKVLLTINLDGRLGKPQDKMEFIPYNYNTDFDGNPIPEVTGIMKHVGKVTNPCTKNVKINQEAYDLFISNEVPYFSKERYWITMNKIERLKAHFARIAEDKLFNFEILDN